MFVDQHDSIPGKDLGRMDVGKSSNRTKSARTEGWLTYRAIFLQKFYDALNEDIVDNLIILVIKTKMRLV
jgi:hypothetical protein